MFFEYDLKILESWGFGMHLEFEIIQHKSWKCWYVYLKDRPVIRLQEEDSWIKVMQVLEQIVEGKNNILSTRQTLLNVLVALMIGKYTWAKNGIHQKQKG